MQIDVAPLCNGSVSRRVTAPIALVKCTLVWVPRTSKQALTLLLVVYQPR